MSLVETHLQSVRAFKGADSALPKVFLPIMTIAENFKRHPSQTANWRTQGSLGVKDLDMTIRFPEALPNPADLSAVLEQWQSALAAMFAAWGAIPEKERTGLQRPNSI